MTGREPGEGLGGFSGKGRDGVIGGTSFAAPGLEAVHDYLAVGSFRAEPRYAADTARSHIAGAYQAVQGYLAASEAFRSHLPDGAGDFLLSRQGVSDDLGGIADLPASGKHRAGLGKFGVIPLGGVFRSDELIEVVEAVIEADSVYEIQIGFVALLGDLSLRRKIVEELIVKTAFQMVFFKNSADDVGRGASGIKAAGTALYPHQGHFRFYGDFAAVAVLAGGGAPEFGDQTDRSVGGYDALEFPAAVLKPLGIVLHQGQFCFYPETGIQFFL